MGGDELGAEGWGGRKGERKREEKEESTVP